MMSCHIGNYLYSWVFKFLLQAAALKGEAPPGLPLKGAGQDSSDAQPKVNIWSKSSLFVFFIFTGYIFFFFFTLLNRLRMVVFSKLVMH